MSGYDALIRTVMFCSGLSLIMPGYSQDLTQLNLTELMEMEVTSVTKTAQKFSDTEAAVFVITREDINRSGAGSIPELLRVVPGLHVARINASQWAITARGGYSGQYANKLLVLIDGRSIYTPIFSGVYWEMINRPLADIERIEIIRGPGASVWGANAVNGIINIITRHTSETLGGYLNLMTGNEERAVVSMRYGSQLDESLFVQGYARWAERDGVIAINGDDAEDDWQISSGGFRLDWANALSDTVMIQGDINHADIERNYVIPALDSPRGNKAVLDDGWLDTQSLLFRWEHTSSLDSRSTLQVYYQREARDDVFTDYVLDTVDIDFQNEFALSEYQDFTWGLNYRYYQDDFDEAEILTVSSEQRHYQLFSLFVQNRISLWADSTIITLGSKFEHNSFSGWEIQPSLRMLWKPAADQRFWAAVSRAARSPSRGDRDFMLNAFRLPATFNSPPVQFVIQGNDSFDSEKVIAYEIGYRVWPASNFFLDMSIFYNDYKDLRIAIAGEPEFSTTTGDITVPITLDNAETAQSYGFEIAAETNVTDWWTVNLAYSYLQTEYQLDRGIDESRLAPQRLGDNRYPRHQVSLHSGFKINERVNLDIWFRYIDEVTDLQSVNNGVIQTISDYTNLDMRLAWQPDSDLTIALNGRNLINSERVEFVQESNTFPTQTERSIYAEVTWQF